VVLRAIRPDDAPRLQQLHQRLSPESIYARFAGPHPVLPTGEAHRLAEVDYRGRMAIVAALAEGEDERLIGVARYAAPADAPHEAEAAIVVEDSFQGRGLGTALMRALVDYARRQGIQTMLAEVSAGNERMLRFIRRSGLPIQQRLQGGSWQIRVDIGSAEA
jgi:RimJ/RimL family protein N-acetyltransferase